MGSTPLEQSIIVIAMTAADDCTHMVRTPPIIRNTSVVAKLVGSNDEKKSSTAWFSPRCMSMPVWRSVPRPRNMNATPKRKSPTFLRFLLYMRIRAMKNAGYTKSVMSNENPADMIHAVSVVPMLAPMITDIACARVSSPALTNDTVITVVAVDDCTAAVTNTPVSIPVKRFVVIA